MRKELLSVVATGLVITSLTPESAIMSEQTEATAVAMTDLKPSIDMSILPKQLPLPDAAQIPNVAAMRRYFKTQAAKQPNGTIKESISYEIDFSGVRIGQDEYITAGHGITQDNGKPVAGINDCGALSIDVMAASSNRVVEDNRGRPVGLSGLRRVALKHAGQYRDEGDSSKVADIALMQAIPMYDNGKSLPYTTPTQLRSKDVQYGLPVFFENYEPTADQESRDPYETSIPAKTDQAGLNRPAMFGGLVVRTLANGTYAVVEGTRSYGQPADAVIRGGASGGPVYDAEGKLVGISDRATGLETVSDFEASEGIDLKGVAPSAKVVMAIVQPVTPQLVSQLRHEVAAAAACVPQK